MLAKTHKLRILLADDSSEHAVAATSLLCDLRLSLHSSIFVVRVFTPGQSHNVWLLEEVLEKTRGKLAAAGHNVTSDLVLGLPAPKIVELAAQQSIDLIVIGAVGLRATLGILLGGVSQQVIEHAEMPVLVVRKPYNGLNHILFATDGSDCSKEALKFIQKFPFPADVRVSVITVLPPEVTTSSLAWTEVGDIPVPPLTPEMEAEFQRLFEQEEKDGEILLERTAREMKKMGVSIDSVMGRGDAATEIIDYAKKNNVDLIVVGSRGLGTVQGWLMGSVSRKLVHYAPCSVLVVKHCGK